MVQQEWSAANILHAIAVGLRQALRIGVTGMAEKPKYFRRFKEITDRDTFDPECEITVENFASLVGEVHLVEDEQEIQCQVKQPDKRKRCEEGHKNGWLGRRKDGKEALIGRNCGIKYFHGHSEFNADRRRITRELNIDRYIERLQATRGNPSYADELTRTIGRLKFVREEILHLQEILPKSIVWRIQEMVKLKNPTFGVRFRYEDEDDEGNLVPEWVPVTIGTIAGIAVWDQSQMALMFRGLYEIRDAHKEAQVSGDAGERKLRNWADKLDELSRHTTSVTDLESALDAFLEPSNLKNLCFLVPNQNDATKAARFSLERETGHTVTTEAAKKLFRELSTALQVRGGGRPFRIDL